MVMKGSKNKGQIQAQKKGQGSKKNELESRIRSLLWYQVKYNENQETIFSWITQYIYSPQKEELYIDFDHA